MPEDVALLLGTAPAALDSPRCVSGSMLCLASQLVHTVGTMVTLPLLKHDMIWYNMMWYAMILYDIMLYDTVWHDTVGYHMIHMIWYNRLIDIILDLIGYHTIRPDASWYDLIALILYDTIYCIHGMTWYHMIWYHLIWHGAVWYDRLRCCMIWYRMVNNMFPRYDMISPHGMLLLDLRQYDMIGHDTEYCMIWYCLNLFDMAHKGYEYVLHVMIRFDTVWICLMRFGSGYDTKSIRYDVVREEKI